MPVIFIVGLTWLTLLVPGALLWDGVKQIRFDKNGDADNFIQNGFIYAVVTSAISATFFHWGVSRVIFMRGYSAVYTSSDWFRLGACPYFGGLSVLFFVTSSASLLHAIAARLGFRPRNF